jgi:hypothetical protein
MNLELMAMVWLRTEKRCEIVLRERSPRSYQCGQPDVLGITPSRYMVEIEVKRSVSDFRADAKKASRRNREFYAEYQPRQFFYFMPEEIAIKVADKIPEWAGLMYPKSGAPVVMKNAPVNTAGKRLTFKEWRRLVSMLTNHLLSSEHSRECERNYFRHGHQPWIPTNVPHFEM